MKVGKPKSKRVPVRLRQKIQKASASKQRKNKRLAKKNPEWRSRTKKDPGIPNLFPFKGKILQEIEESKRRKAEDVLQRREQARTRRLEEVTTDAAGDAVMGDTIDAEDDNALLDYEDDSDDQDEAMNDDSSNPMAALLASARARADEYDHNGGNPDLDNMGDGSDDGIAASFDGFDNVPASSAPTKDTSRRAHSKAFQETISASDVILYILDARDPAGTRSPETERLILSDPSKRLILILNKIDLVPDHILQAWLVHLRRSFPTLPLRASTSAATNAKVFDTKTLTAQATAATLLKALKNYAGAAQLKRPVSVGIIGYPNVGKSSVVNALTSRLDGNRHACPVGAEAGVTTAVREVKLDGKIKLLDCPGIVFPSSSSSSSSCSGSDSSSTRDKVEEQARLILLNAVPPKEISDPVPAVTLLLKRLSASPELERRLFEVYDIPPLMKDASKDVTTDFLVQVARKRGRLGKGGVPNLHSAAQTVVGDWRDGRIVGWVEAPKLGTAPGAAAAAAESGSAGDAGVGGGDRKEIVTEWAKEFKIEGLWGDGGDEVG